MVVQIGTLQHLRKREKMLRETARGGSIGIVRFKKFEQWETSLEVEAGRMLVTRVLPYQW